MTGITFKKFRNTFLKEFNYEEGMLFQVSYFTDVKVVWGIDFSIWSGGETLNKNEFKYTLKDVDDNNNIIIIDYKDIYNIDSKETCSDWIKEDVKKPKTEEAHQLGSALIVKPKGVGSVIPGALGYYFNVENSVYKNETDVFIVLSTSSRWHGISIMNTNFDKVVSNFSERKIIICKYVNWTNDKYEYLITNIEHPKYEEWNGDAMIYFIILLNTKYPILKPLYNIVII